MKNDHERTMSLDEKVERMLARAKTDQVLNRLATELEDQGKPIPAKELRTAAESFYQKAINLEKKLGSSI